MSKLSRYTQLIFGSTAGLNKIGQFGSLAAGTPAYATTPAQVQALSNYLTGWFGAILGNNSPAIEDMNALCFLYAYQLAYLFQAGVAEWDSSTTYYIGSMVNSAGLIYVSLTDANLNNAVTDGTKWKQYQQNAPTIQKFLSGSGTYTKPAGVLYIKVTMVGGGGGGGGATNNSTGGVGTAGTASTFGTTLLSAGGGLGGDGGTTATDHPTGGAGGSSSLGTGPSGIALTGGGGCSGINMVVDQYVWGGQGGSSAFGGAGKGAFNGIGGNGVANTGGGGAGGGYSGGGVGQSGAGGGSGGYVHAMITSPSATYPYSVGGGGAHGAATPVGNNGGDGGSGFILVEEFYQ